MLTGKPGEANSENKSATRYSATIGGEKAVVIPSDTLATLTENVLQNAMKACG